jgi:hypothetical protein
LSSIGTTRSLPSISITLTVPSSASTPISLSSYR